MADLDDFFAKKDRKKSKTSVKKFPTAEEMSKKIDETRETCKKPELKPRKEPATQLVEAADGTVTEEAVPVQEVGRTDT